MQIRFALKSDAEKCFLIAKKDGDKYWQKKDFEKSVSSPYVIFLVAEQNKEILGYILGSITPTKCTEASIHETRVNKKRRNEGIGTKLVNKFCLVASKKGIKKVYMLGNKKEAEFYIKKCKFNLSNNLKELIRKV